jgi:hypothetical protein
MPGLVQPGVDVSALLALTGLTGLFVGGDVYDDAVAANALAQLRSLRELEVCDAPQLTDQGLLACAALTRLTRLVVLCCGLSDVMPTYLHARCGAIVMAFIYCACQCIVVSAGGHIYDWLWFSHDCTSSSSLFAVFAFFLHQHLLPAAAAAAADDSSLHWGCHSLMHMIFMEQR